MLTAVDVDTINREHRRSKIVMAVDDAPETLSMLKALVSAAGYSFMGARTGKECLDLVTRAVPRLILLDVRMPDMDGFETCRRLRALFTIKQVPIAFLTTTKTAEDVRNGLNVGGNDFIIKPFDAEKLLLRVQHWTARRV